MSSLRARGDERALEADRLLLAGGVRVVRRRPGLVVATVQDGAGRWSCGWDQGHWWCECRSHREPYCPHLLALRRVADPPARTR